MKKLRVRRLFLIIIAFVAIVVFGIIIYYSKNKSSESSTPQEEADYNVEEVLEAFIEEEQYNPQEHTTPEEILLDQEIHLSGWIAYWDFYGALDTYKNNTGIIESLSPTWYYLKADGTLGLKNTARNNELRDLCKNNKTKLIPTISNSSAQELSAILNSDNSLNTHINAIVNEVKTYGYDGIDIDYEQILGADRDRFTKFVERLATKLHEDNKVLTIAILWKNDLESVLEGASESRMAQDWEAIGEHVDEFRIMAYDYTHSYNSDGPIAPRDWIRSILDYALTQVDDLKIVLGLPLYAYEWTEGTKGAKALVWNDVNSRIQTYQSTISYNELDPEYFEKKLVYNVGGVNKIVWYQDGESTEKRIEIVQTYGINKFIFWRLGGEDPEVFKF